MTLESHLRECEERFEENSRAAAMLRVQGMDDAAEGATLRASRWQSMAEAARQVLERRGT